MYRRSLLTASFVLLFVSTVFAGETPKRVLLLAGKDSHGYGAHHHMAGIKVLAKCLEGVSGLETSIHFADGKWPEGPELIRRADGIVLFMDMGMHWEQADPDRQSALADLMARGGGFVALHWAVGGRDAKLIPFHLRLLGGCHGGPDRKYTHAETMLNVASRGHPILNGIKDFRINDEFYFQLKWAKEGKVTPLLTATIEECPDQAAAWAFERTDGGRSFGFVCLHAHGNWRLVECRRLVTQAVLWTVKLPVPKEGLPVDVSDEVLRLPPQGKKK